MRKILSLIIFISFATISFAQNDPVLFSVEEDEVLVSEFKYIYEKNNGANADYSEASLKDYLELYTKFKLKVQRAKEMGLDTITALQTELAGYRKQLANSYLVDKEVASKLTSEVAERMKTDIRVSHIFIPAETKSSREKEIAAKEKISDIKSKLDMGTSFESLAREFSEDKASAVRGGDLGYYVAPLPNGFYDFENALYNTEIGKTSDPVKSKMGYHILKVTDKREARGEMEVAHILLRKKLKGQLVEDVESKIKGIYDELESGANFDQTASSYSDDKKSSSKGGYLGFFGINQFEKTFEDIAFALTKDGEYSKPVETQVGWHIIKRISKRDNGNEKELIRRVKSMIAKSDRFEIAQKALTEKIKTESNFKESTTTLNDFISKLDKEFYSYKWQIPELAPDFLMSFGSEKYTIVDFAKFVKKQTRERLRFNKMTPLNSSTMQLYEKFVEDAAVKYEEANLENKYPDFKALMREYEEGILLFEATKIEVWDKASMDTLGLNQFFEENQNNYHWKTRVNLVQYEIKSDDSKLCKKIYKSSLKESPESLLEKYNDETQLLSFSKSTYEEGSKELNNMTLKANEGSALIFDENSQSTKFKVVKEIIPPRPKSINEARGYIIADYQDHLEKEWISKLRNKYAISVKDEVLGSLIR